jgi:hypothetical protein
MVQLPPAATLEPQWLMAPKSPGLIPPMVTLAIFSVEEPLLVTVTFWGALVVPTSWVA